MRPADGDRGHRESTADADEEPIELVDSEGTLIADEMVDVLAPDRGDVWNVRRDERPQ